MLGLRSPASLLQPGEASCSGRCSLGGPALRRAAGGAAARLPPRVPQRRLAGGRVVVAQFSRRPAQPTQPTQWAATEQQQQEQWAQNRAYDYAPPPGTARPPPGPPGGGAGGGRGPGGDGGGGGGMSNLTKAFVAGAFILGMGAGIMFDYEVSFEPQNVASTVLVDTKTPNSEVGAPPRSRALCHSSVCLRRPKGALSHAAARAPAWP